MEYQAVWVDFGLMLIGLICLDQLYKLRERMKELEEK